jgi:formate dehydrogenase major subunit
MMPALDNISWDRVEREDAVTYPSDAPDKPGRPVVFENGFPRPGGLGKLVAAKLTPPDETPDHDYPFILSTGRQLEHWHTGSMTRRAAVLDHIEPEPVASVHPFDLAELGIEPGETLTIESRRGAIALYARADDGTPRGSVFVPFCYYEAAANMLTNPALDPYGKIPEFKYCAVRVSQGGPTPARMSFGGGTLLPQESPGGSSAPRPSGRPA